LLSPSSPTPLDRLAHELAAPVAALRSLSAAARDPARQLPAARVLALAIAAARDVERLLADPALHGYRRVVLALEDVLAPLAVGREEHVRLEGAEGLTLTGDATRLRQALGNLVANGLRHGTHVTVSACRVGGEVVVVVGDDGPGVASGIDPFADGVSGAGSSGLGLGIARQVAEAHGGTLDVVPSASGACFRLALPSSAGGP
jgi:signal transduction histidine kinase